MPDETNIQESTDTPVTEVTVPTDAATDTPVSVSETPADDASSTPVSESVDVPPPVENTPVEVEPAPVVAAPVVEPTPPVVQNAPIPTTPDKFSQNQSLWRQWLQKATDARKQREFNNISKLYQYILKRKKATGRDIQLFMLCRKSTMENYLNTLIKQNQIKRVGETGNTKTFYQPIN